MPVNLPAGSALARPCPRSVSILSWNVLLPNSRDGWWLYKYYPPGVPAAATRWEARRELLEQTIGASQADIVCLQECSALSFASDFAFLFAAGYSAALHGKGRMRPATFWRSDRLRLCGADGAELPPADEPHGEEAPAAVGAAEHAVGGGPGDPSEAALVARFEAKRPGVLHGDRTLTTSFRVRGEDGADVPGCPPLWVTNCHLTAGPEARRRLRQVHEALDAIRKAREVAAINRAAEAAAINKAAGAAAMSTASEAEAMNRAGAAAISTASEAETVCRAREAVAVGRTRDTAVVFTAQANAAAGREGAATGGGAAGRLTRGQVAGGSVPSRAAAVVCGDMNSQGRSAVRELLETGLVWPSFRESGDPTESEQVEVTSRARRQEIGRFACAYAGGAAPTGALAGAQVGGQEGGGAGGGDDGGGGDEGGEAAPPPVLPPPTMYAASLSAAMRSPDGSMSPALVSALTECFETLSAGGASLDCAATDAWLRMINGSPDRGSESRAAAACRAENGSDLLSLHDFLTVYQAELDQGKYWGVEHDVRMMRGVGMWVEGSTPFTATFDQLYYTAGALRLRGVLEPVSAQRRAALLAGSTWLPNEWAPSDHLPIGAVLTLEDIPAGEGG
eukprot:scaffold7391_cov95-Isochrysis_galbana.AAC.2